MTTNLMENLELGGKKKEKEADGKFTISPVL
jgi:hypothetical protein